MRTLAPLAAPVLLVVAAAATAQSPSATDPVARLRAEAAALAPVVSAPTTRAFLDATAHLPRLTPRILWRDSSRTRWWSDSAAGALDDSTRSRLVRRPLEESYYWNTRYGSPLAYSRALDVAARHGFRDWRGARVLDFGCGTLGHLRLMALLGAHAVGVDVDPSLAALYSQPGDQGPMRAGRGPQGSLRLVTGQWPATEETRSLVGEGYDLVLSKNTLKNGYLHPAEKVDPRMLVHLGVPDSAFIAHLGRIVRKGGWVVIYNLSPAPAPPGKPYIPWADGRMPFPRADWEAAGFEVLEHDSDDGVAARTLGRALGWDQGPQPMDLERDLFAHVGVYRRR